eukprot:COSAG02_NODE_62361_length_266_cov_0.616766_1_plen_31_part_01
MHPATFVALTDLSVYWASVQTIRILESKVDA